MVEVLVKPSASDITVAEGDELRLQCNNNQNIPGLTAVHWLDSRGQTLTIISQNEFVAVNVTRNYTGVYTCLLMSTRDENITTNSTATVTVQCKSSLPN